MDFGIIVIKPDGVKSDVCIECEQELQNRNINILSRKRIKLDKDAVKKYFYYDFEKYIEYMTEGDICAYFIASENMDLDTEIFFIKDIIRKRRNVSGKVMRNYIHGSHCGTEFFWQRKLFFPEYESFSHTAYADEIVDCKGGSIEKLQYITYILENSNIKKYSIVFCEDDIKNNKELFEYILKNKINIAINKKICIGENEYELLYYISNNVIEALDTNNMNEDFYKDSLVVLLKYSQTKTLDNKRVYAENILEYTTLTEENEINKVRLIVKCLRENGVNICGMCVNDSNMNVREAEIYFEVAKKLKLIPVGGSNNSKNVGLFGFSKTKYKLLADKLNW